MDRKPLEESKVVKSPVYDPKKNYEWQPDDKFTVTGAEIDIWNKGLLAVVTTPEFQKFIQVQAAAITMSNFIKESVEQGIILEQVKPKPEDEFIEPIV